MRRLDTTLLKFVDDEADNINLDDMEWNLGHQGKFIEVENQRAHNMNELGGQQEGGQYQAWRRAQTPDMFDHTPEGKMKEEQYLGVRFVDINMDQADQEAQKALSVEQMGSKGFLVSGGAFSDPSEYALPEKKILHKKSLKELDQFMSVVDLNKSTDPDYYDEEEADKY